MIHFEDNAREALLQYLQKPKKKLELPEGKGTVLKKFKKDKIGEDIYVIDNDENGVIDDEIKDNIIRHGDFKDEKVVQLFHDKYLKEKYLVIFNKDFPTWLITALSEIGEQPSNYGFSNQKGKFHLEIRDKSKLERFNSLLVALNRNNSPMLNTLKKIFTLINHK